MSRWYGGRAVMGEPSMRMCPLEGCSNPAIMRRVVVLPEPDAPRSVRNSPAATRSVRPSTATKSPKRLVSCLSSRIDSAGDWCRTVSSSPGFDLIPDFLILLPAGTPLPEVHFTAVVGDISLARGLLRRHIIPGRRIRDDVCGDVVQQLLGKWLRGVLQPGVCRIQILRAFGEHPVVGPRGGSLLRDRLSRRELGLPKLVGHQRPAFAHYHLPALEQLGHVPCRYPVLPHIGTKLEHLRLDLGQILVRQVV